MDLGGGIVKRKDRVRFMLGLHAPMTMPEGELKALTWQLDKESSFYQDVIMDWAFARNFLCGSCGAHQVEYRLQDEIIHVRCMHCATDHKVDMDEAMAVPIIVD